jgi:hypothetical protein
MKHNSLSSIILVLCIIGTMKVAFCASTEMTKEDTWKFAVLCDTRGDNNNYTSKTGINDTMVDGLANEVINERCELVLVPGDMINGWWANGSTSYRVQFLNWNRLMQKVRNKSIKVYTVRGNHEDGQSVYPPVPPYSTIPDPALKAAYIKAFENPNNGPENETFLSYSFANKNAFFVGLDEYVTPHRVNQTWLDGQLEQNNKSFVFVFGHEPAYAINHLDCLAYYSTQRWNFWNSIGKAGGKIYFCGHDHLYDRSHILDSSGNKIYQLVLGSGGAPRTNWTPPYYDGSVIGDFHNNTGVGYILVTVGTYNATVEWKEWNANEKKWVTKDSFNVSARTKPEETLINDSIDSAQKKSNTVLP